MIHNWVDELFTSDHILSFTSSFCRRILCNRSLFTIFWMSTLSSLQKGQSKMKLTWHWQGPICKTGFIGKMVTIDLPCPTHSNKRQLDGFFMSFRFPSLRRQQLKKGGVLSTGQPNIWLNPQSRNHSNIVFCSEGCRCSIADQKYGIFLHSYQEGV